MVDLSERLRPLHRHRLPRLSRPQMRCLLQSPVQKRMRLRGN